jgi:ubiquinone/menaquinone biosynthesis C-methylase UbiE
MSAKPHSMLADLSHDDASRQAYAATLRSYTLGVLTDANREICDQVVAPQVAARGVTGREADRAVIAGMEVRDEHRLWQVFSQTWQDLIWHYCMDSVDRQLPALVDRFRQTSATARGTLVLDPELPLPRYQVAADNHRFPGSYYTETCDDDVRQGAVLDRAAHTYMGNQLGGEMHDRRGHTLISHIRERFPDLRLERILDIGCQNGASTVPWARTYPDAEVHAIDTAAPVLRYAHARSESLGARVHYAQQNAEHTDFPHGHFDLVVSHVVLHETTHSALRAIFRECHRLLRPGGVMAHLEVPFRQELMSPWLKVMSAREGRYNQEPFWIGLTGADLTGIAEDAGFVDARMGFQTTVGSGVGAAPGFAPLSEGKSDLSNWFVISAVKA